eukprot:XP_014022993.1 PREDICTED: uncharacterized protein LOC106583398 isoform X1 [Salmo salar]
MEWLDSSGTILPADGPPERHREEDLYTVRRHVSVNQTDTNRFACRVKQPEINQLKETEIHISDDVFPKSQVGLIVGLSIAAAVVVLAATVGVYKWRKHIKEKRHRTRKMFFQLMTGHGEALFVNINRDHLILNVTMVIPIAFYLIRSEMYSKIHAARTSQKQMRLLYQALDSGGDKMKTAFYRILLDLEPYLVYHLDELSDNLPGQLGVRIQMGRPKDSDEEDLYLDELIQNLPGQLEKIRKQRDELKEKLRKAEETIQTLSTSSDGQQKTQTPSQKSEGIEGMEMESLPGRKSAPGPGRKSAPEMKPLLAAGPQKDDLDELERGGRDTTEFNYRETIPSGRKSGPEKEMEMKPLLGPGPQKDDLDELERGGRVTTEFNYVL